ncbi:uncharacterized protein LOC120007558 isoform X2 [Tripterygium wilfordii]|uniref:uncharacterized protein LOC120007558 isoform X2 n=1 Tax=Tripterygium wilfordii TaxID=458696 RepID=UPI0018F85956|nr:uncharacterized protein LOC120007558 isoform X2 [Tripterygium wilfordii]
MTIPDHCVQWNNYCHKWWYFAVSSVVQVIGIIISIHTATKISHRAQNITSLASRWHALAACCPADASQLRTSNNSRLASYMSSYHKRHAFGSPPKWCIGALELARRQLLQLTVDRLCAYGNATRYKRCFTY